MSQESTGPGTAAEVKDVGVPASSSLTVVISRSARTQELLLAFHDCLEGAPTTSTGGEPKEETEQKSGHGLRIVKAGCGAQRGFCLSKKHRRTQFVDMILGPLIV